MKIRNLLLIMLLAFFGVARADGEHWTWDPYQYGDNATFVAVIDVDGVEQRSDQLEIAAFCDDECRGSIICVYVPQKDRYFAYLTVNGTNGMEMDFRLWDHETETELDVTCDIIYTFIRIFIYSNNKICLIIYIFRKIIYSINYSSSRCSH